MKIVDRIALVLVIIGALNWGGVGLFSFDCVAFLFGGQPHHLYAGGHRGTVVHHPAVPRGWDGEHINTEKDRREAVFFCVYRLVIIMDKTCCGAVQVENGSPFWAAAAEKTRPCQSMVPYCFMICCTFSFGLQPLCR